MPSASATFASQQTATRAMARPAGRATPKMIAGIGAVLTLGAIAAIVSMNSQPSPTTSVAPIESVYSVPLQSAAEAPAAVASLDRAPAPLAYVPTPAPMYIPAAAPAQRECSLPLRKFYVSGSGVVRVRDGDYVSPALVLDSQPQEVVFPSARPTAGLGPTENIVIEGQARAVVMTSDLAGFQKIFRNVRGAASFKTQWAALKNC